jgi:ssDNA-binding replication factor A large subunit
VEILPNRAGWMSKRDKELMEYYDLKFAISSESSWDKTLKKYGTKGFFTGTTQNHVMLEPSRERKDDTVQDQMTQESRKERNDETLKDHLMRQPQKAKDKTPRRHLTIGEIVEGMNGISAVGEVEAVGERKLVKTRFGEAYVATAVLRDGTGRVLLDLWRNQIEAVKAGDRIEMHNGVSRKYGNEIHVFVPSAGAIAKASK